MHGQVNILDGLELVIGLGCFTLPRFVGDRGPFYLSYNRVAMAKKMMPMAKAKATVKEGKADMKMDKKMSTGMKAAMKKVEGSKADMAMDKKLAMKMMKKGKK